MCAPHLSSLLTPTVPLAQSLCLPVYADEILSSMDSREAPDVLPETELVSLDSREAPDVLPETELVSLDSREAPDVLPETELVRRDV